MLSVSGQEKLTALVIGGSGGIGAAVSRTLAKHCQKLWIHGGQDLAKLDELTKQLNSGKCQTQGIFRPFSGATDFIEAIPKLEPDILVISFGPVLYGSLAQTSPADWEWMASANLALPGALISTYAPHMAKRGFGKIFVFGSSNSDTIRSYRQTAAYASAKTGLSVLIKSAAREFGRSNVQIIGLCPAYVETEYYTKEEFKGSQKKKAVETLQNPGDWAKMIEIMLAVPAKVVNGAILTSLSDLS